MQFTQWVPFPLQRVFAFFSDPRNLPRIMPPASATKLIVLNRIPPADRPDSVAAGLGSTIVTSFRIIPHLPFRARWISRITEFEWNDHFADVQEEGPFQRWHHRHEFEAEIREGTEGSTPGTLIRDVIDYEVGFSFLGTIANSLFIRRQMEHTFAQRQQALPRLLT